MGYTVAQLVDELMEMLNAEDAQVYHDDRLMLNVAGRWTGIKGISIEPGGGLVLLESDD